MKVLLIYELIPESTKFYVFPAVDGNSDLFKHLVGANGHYSNYDGDVGDNEHTDFLNEYLDNQSQISVSELPEVHGIDLVVHSGFGL